MTIHNITTGNLKTNCYLINCDKTKKGVVIDPGGQINKIIQILKENEINLEFIFNTHFHADHTGGNRKLKRLTKAKIVMHKNDIPFLRRLISGDKLVTLNLSLSPKPDIIIDHEIIFAVGTLEFKILHTPGHTPGGLCFYIQDKLFTGDTLFVGDSGTTQFKGGHRPTLGASIRRIMNDLPGETVIYPGHDYGPTPTSTLDWEKRNNVNAREYGFYLEK